jgi:hypothetical protein
VRASKETILCVCYTNHALVGAGQGEGGVGWGWRGAQSYRRL